MTIYDLTAFVTACKQLHEQGVAYEATWYADHGGWGTIIITGV